MVAVFKSHVRLIKIRLGCLSEISHIALFLLIVIRINCSRALFILAIYLTLTRDATVRRRRDLSFFNHRGEIPIVI